MHAIHGRAGDWSLMAHWNAFLQYIDESGDRGDEQLGSVNWVMGMATRSAGGGLFMGRAMLSLEPLTVPRCGYPDLLATGELCRGETIHDHQHPHDLFMELAARYQHPIFASVAYEFYGALSGEPALGPTAFPHRLSAMPNPMAPISHHWLDSSHISFGVVTAGLYGSRWKAEASVFNGREPDESRYGIDLGPLDSYSARVWFLPSASWALQVSAGHLDEAETDPDGVTQDVNRATASATYHRPLGPDGVWASTVAWGRNDPPIETATDAFLLETNLTTTRRHVVFARLEVSEKTGDELALPAALADEVGTLTKLQGGYAYELVETKCLVLAVGGSLWLSIVPDVFAPFYGGNTSPGLAAFLNVHPPAMPGMH